MMPQFEILQTHSSSFLRHGTRYLYGRLDFGYCKRLDCDLLLVLMQESSGSGQRVKGIYNNAMTPAIWKAQNESEVPSVIFSSSQRASIAQVYTCTRDFIACSTSCYICTSGCLT
jgi:hypothetical protein